KQGVAPAQASARDYALYVHTDEDWPLRDGYGALVAAYGAGLPVRLSTPVRAADWRGPGVTLATSGGAIAARAAIVPASVCVLAAEIIEFEPALPSAKRQALDLIPMGSSNKVALRFDCPLFDAHEGFVTAAARDGLMIGFDLAPFGRPLAIAYL